MHDITAIVLTTGEKTTQKAIDSIHRQTVVPEEIIIVRNVSPFHKAINYGASRVNTKYFVQVDSDMILDDNCLECLLMCMDEKTGVSIGYLQDEIAGVINGVRMVRTECFNNNYYRNLPNTENRFLMDTLNDGWRIRYALYYNNSNNGIRYPHTVGYHKPKYTPLYTYSRYFFNGFKLGLRKEIAYLKLWIYNIFGGDHDYSIIAKAAFSNGLFSTIKTDKDILTPDLYRTRTKDYEFLCDFVSECNNYNHKEIEIASVFSETPDQIFGYFYELGMKIRKNWSVNSLNYFLGLLNQIGDESKWLAKIALCRGIFVKSNIDEQIKKDFELISRFS